LYKYWLFSCYTYISGAGGIAYALHAAAALLWAWVGSVFGHAFKRLVLAPCGDLVSWIKLLMSVGLWVGETAPIPQLFTVSAAFLLKFYRAPAGCGTGSRRWVGARRIPLL